MKRWRHRKRGTTYTEVGVAELQCEPLRMFVEGAKLQVYRSEDGRLWARSIDEFNDGRFEPINEPTIDPKNFSIDILRARVELLREAHTAANDALRSALSVAERDGLETNWPVLRETLRYSLEVSHAALNALCEGDKHDGKIT